MPSRFLSFALALGVIAATSQAPAVAQDRSIIVASTTSTQDSGLFGYLLPIFKAKTNIDVKVIAQGTGQALDTARRGDKSGTHSAELALWKQADIDIAAVKGPWYREIGQGMGAALNTAAAMNGYVLSDRGTWISFRNRGDLEIVVEGDKRLFNQYAVMLVNPEKYPSVKKELGQTFIDWLISAEGQTAIAGYKIDGQQLFFPNAEKKGA